MPHVIRPGLATDEGFIAQCWVREFRESNRLLQHLEPAAFNKFCYPRVYRLLRESTVRVACPLGDDVTIYGFAVFTSNVIHMVYVRSALRKSGVAKSLLHGIDMRRVTWTTETRDFHNWIRSKYRFRWHKPFWLMEVTPEDVESWENQRR